MLEETQRSSQGPETYRRSSRWCMTAPRGGRHWQCKKYRSRKKSVDHLHLIFDGFIPLALKDMETGRECLFFDILLVPIIFADRHAAGFAHGWS